ncbi:MAG: hypothetical protein K8R73_09445 [Clostridiales bacterium]|nr:hypothetical protein [Clostridiales bacterium]
MKLDQFTKWKLLYEDDTQCFSSATDKETENEVVVITHYQPDSLTRTVRHLLKDHLHNVLDTIEDDNGFHIIFKKLGGSTLKKYLKQNQINYETRVQMVYDWLKSLIIYEQFPDAIKIQLVDVDQIAVVDHQLKSRELIDYSNEDSVELTEVFGQIGMTIEKVLYDSKGYHSEFIDNLLIGTHSIFSFNLLRKQFKDIFIYEKTDALKSVNFEYNIVINDLESEAPVLKTIPKQSKPSAEQIIHEEITDSVPSDIIKEAEISFEDELIMESEPVEPALSVPGVEIVPNEMDVQDVQDTEEVPVSHDEDIPDVLPSASSSRKPREVDDEDELDYEMNNLFTGTENEHEEDLIIKKKLPIVPIVIGILLVILIFFGGKMILGNEPVEAHFIIEPLMESRVAFMNESTGKKNIDEYLWEIYFEDEFVQSFSDENLFPIFETEGKYTITLKAKDKDGEWSEPYSLEYDFEN